MSRDFEGEFPGTEGGRPPLDSGCRFHRQRLHLHLEGELPPPARRYLAAHLEECAACRRELERLEAERLRLLESMVEAPELPASFAAKVIDTLRRREEVRTRRTALLRRRFALGLAAGVLIGSAAVALGLWTLDAYRRRAGEAPAVAASDPETAPPSGGAVIEAAKAAPAILPDAGSAPAGEPVDRARKPGSRAPVFIGFDLLEVWEKVTDSKGCTEDINQDGAADIADAAFLFNNHYLSAVPVQASWSSQEVLGLPDCSRWCEVHQHNL